MTPSLPRRQTLRESLPSFFETNKSSWPSPADSIGQKCLCIDGLNCWQVIGPALEAMEKLSIPIKELLDKHQEVLEQGESKPRAVSFNMWMIGHLPVSARPTIVFSSKSKRQRTGAKVLLKESKLLDEYPGIKIRTLDRNPAIYQSAERTSATTADNISQNGVYMVDDSRGPCGALIAFEGTQMATMGGILLINGVHYGISAQHARLGSLPEQEGFSMDSDTPCFDDDSDSESDGLIEITSEASVSSDEEVGTDSFVSSPTDSVFDHPYDPQGDTQTGDDTPIIAGSGQSQSIQGRQISSVSTSCVENDLDYEIFRIYDPLLQGHNSILLSENQGTAPTSISPNHVVRRLVESNVWAATGTTGLVGGTIMKTPYFIKMERSQTFQEMWAVRLDRKTMQGDCGAWVVDALTGGIYGHVVAGDLVTGLAFIVPAYKIFDDIELRFGRMPLLPTKSCTETSSSLTASTSNRQQSTHSSRLQPVEESRFVSWLFWTLQDLRCTPEERQQFPKSLLSLDNFGRCFDVLLADPMACIYLFSQVESALQRSRRGHDTSFVYHPDASDLDHRRQFLYQSLQLATNPQVDKAWIRSKILHCLPTMDYHLYFHGSTSVYPKVSILLEPSLYEWYYFIVVLGKYFFVPDADPSRCTAPQWIRELDLDISEVLIKLGSNLCYKYSDGSSVTIRLFTSYNRLTVKDILPLQHGKKRWPNSVTSSKSI